MNIMIVGIDLAKNVLAVNEYGKPDLNKTTGCIRPQAQPESLLQSINF